MGTFNIPQTVLALGSGGSSGADALGTYIVQTASHAPSNAQVLASLSTGFMFVTTITGVITSVGSTGSGNVVLSTAPTLSGTITEINAGLATTVADGLVLSNTTASTSGATVQNSPGMHFQSHAWNTTVTAADNYIDAINYLIPVSGTAPSGRLIWSMSTSTTSTPSYSEIMELNSLAVNNNAGPALMLNRGLAGTNYGFTAGNSNLYVFVGSASAAYGFSSGGTFTAFNAGLVAGTTITTGAPNGGTAAPWKLGVLVTATSTPSATQYLQVDVSGVLYKVVIN